MIIIQSREGNLIIKLKSGIAEFFTGLERI